MATDSTKLLARDLDALILRWLLSMPALLTIVLAFLPTVTLNRYDADGDVELPEYADSLVRDPFDDPATLFTLVFGDYEEARWTVTVPAAILVLLLAGCACLAFTPAVAESDRIRVTLGAAAMVGVLVWVWLWIATAGLDTRGDYGSDSVQGAWGYALAGVVFFWFAIAATSVPRDNYRR